MTKSITLAVDEKVLEEVRNYAARQNTTVTALVRDYLTSIAASTDRQERFRRRFTAALEKSAKLEVGPMTWKREDLYDR